MRTIVLALCCGLVTLSLAQYPGALDTTFLPNDLGHGHGDGCNEEVLAAALQPDGKVLIGGLFSTHNGQARARLSRLNEDGTIDTTFTPPSATINGVRRLAVQPDGKVLVGGYFTGCLKRLTAAGWTDVTFIVGSGFSGGTVPEVNAIAVQADGKILVGGTFGAYNGTTVSNIVRLNANGTMDMTFNTGSMVNGAVRDIVVQPDGKIVLVGSFTYYFGSSGRMVRLNTDGTVDATFQRYPGANSHIYDIDLRADGSFLIAGAFIDVHTAPNSQRVVRLQANGAVDANFNQTVATGGTVYAVTEQADGNILVGGGWVGPFLYRVTPTGTADPTFNVNFPPVYFTQITEVLERPDGRIFITGPETRVGDRPMHRYCQLNTDSSWDATFGPGQAFNSGAFQICRQPDGRMVVAGAFNAFFDRATGGVVRLNVDGSLDTTFQANWNKGQVNRIVLQPDGKILLAGQYDEAVVRLNSDGTPDPSFNAGTGNNWAEDLVLQPDGKIIVTGGFLQFNGVPSPRLVRLNADGSVDPSFNVGTGLSSVNGWALALQPDGRVIVGGGFTDYNGTAVGRICRLLPNGDLDPTFVTGSGFNSQVYGMALLPDGRIFVAGGFVNYNGLSVYRCILLQPDGSVDGSFTPPTGVMYANPRPLVHYDPIGKILVRTVVNSSPEAPSGIARFNLNGTLDPTFLTGDGFKPQGHVYDAEIGQDSSYTIVGAFTNYNGFGRNRIARIEGGIAPQCAVQVRMLLDGAFTGAVMTVTLSNLGLLPLTEPYTGLGYAHAGGGGGESVASAGYLTAMTDWVVVELRDALDPSMVVASQSALLRNDGRVFDHRLFSSVVFDVPHGDYYVAVRHRNHLGAMTATAQALTDVPQLVDFVAPATPTYGTNAQKNVGIRNMLWAGNANSNSTLKYMGGANDRDPILLAIGGVNPTNTLAGYHREDVNLDGVVKYVGASNDRDPILVNLPGSTPTAVRTEQLP